VHDVEGEEQELEEGHVGDPIGRGDPRQGVVGEQFPDVLLDAGALRVEAPHPPGVGPEVGHQDVVGRLLVREEGELFASTGSVGMGRRTTTKRCGVCQCPGWYSNSPTSHPLRSFWNRQPRASRLMGAYSLATTA